MPKVRTKTTETKILVKKMLSSPIDLFKDAPSEFLQFMIYVKSLQFEERPNYEYLESLLQSIRKKDNLTNYVLTWSLPKPKPIEDKRTHSRSHSKLNHNSSIDKRSHSHMPRNGKNFKRSAAKTLVTDSLSKSRIKAVKSCSNTEVFNFSKTIELKEMPKFKNRAKLAMKIKQLLTKEDAKIFKRKCTQVIEEANSNNVANCVLF